MRSFLKNVGEKLSHFITLSSCRNSLSTKCSNHSTAWLVRVGQSIRKHEGVVPKIYLDHLGHKTFGVGHLVTPDDPEYNQKIGTSVPEDRVEEVFARDLQIAYNNCYKLFGPCFCTWPRPVCEVLINMMFNLGYGGLSKFVNMRQALMDRDWKRAAAEGRDSLWYHQVSNRAEELMTRLENVDS